MTYQRTRAKWKFWAEPCVRAIKRWLIRITKNLLIEVTYTIETGKFIHEVRGEVEKSISEGMIKLLRLTESIYLVK